jgi:argininosuccinate lyase
VLVVVFLEREDASRVERTQLWKNSMKVLALTRGKGFNNWWLWWLWLDESENFGYRSTRKITNAILPPPPQKNKSLMVDSIYQSFLSFFGTPKNQFNNLFVFCCWLVGWCVSMMNDRMWDQDIRGSIAYAKANAKVGIISQDEADILVKGLEQVREEWAAGKFEIKVGDEDIHTANERRLTELVGTVGGKLHTGRSRNDQVATDTRLWTVEAERDILKDMATLLTAAAEYAQQHIGIIMSGYTHLQPAQPIRFSHWLLSHLAPLVRDAQRLQDMIPRANMCPLGSGALAGNAFGIDREFLASELNFDGVTSNSLDSVCDRDFVVEFLMWHALLLTHISQFAEDVIITNLLKGIDIDDAYATGSSLMPQKKNPDALELLRGKAGIALGRAVGFTATLKGLPRAYNKDLQEDKVPLFDAVDTVKDCLAIATGVIVTMKPNPEMLKKALSPEMLATDLADYLVRKGVPFRETHHIRYDEQMKQ